MTSVVELDELDLRKLTITPGRWTVRIEVEKPDGTKATWIASADSGDTFGDGIWFGTQDEYDEHLARAW